MKDNKLIAEFWGMVLGEDGTMYYDDVENFFPPTPTDKLKFHYDWNWLMKVVDKIEDDDRYDVDILQYGTRIRDNQKEIISNVADISFENKIEHTYDVVVKFIKEHNKVKRNR